MKNGLRLPYQTLSLDAYKGLIATNLALEKSTLGKSLIELVYLRVSQINGCAFCLEMHACSLRKEGVDTRKLDSLAGWRISPQFDEREKSALAWTESLTNISENHAPDELFEALKKHFSDVEISDLSFAIALMNALNRMAISMRQ